MFEIPAYVAPFLFIPLILIPTHIFSILRRRAERTALSEPALEADVERLSEHRRPPHAPQRLICAYLYVFHRRLDSTILAWNSPEPPRRRFTTQIL